MSLRQKIRHLRRETVTVLGETVEVRQLSARARVALEDSVARDAGGKADAADMLVRLVVASTCDGAGQPAFAAEDVPWLLDEADSEALTDLFAAASRVNGLAKVVGGQSEKN